MLKKFGATPGSRAEQGIESERVRLAQRRLLVQGGLLRKSSLFGKSRLFGDTRNRRRSTAVSKTTILAQVPERPERSTGDRDAEK